MMSDITKFMGSKKSREENVMERFLRLVKKAKTKSEIREIELRLLKPKPIPQYTGSKTGRSDFKKRNLLVVFDNPNKIEKLAKYFKINTYVENNTYDTDWIVELLRLMDNDKLIWDAKQKKFKFINSKGRRVILQ